MCTAPLRPHVEAEWILGGTFLGVTCTEDGDRDPARTPYEARYLIGRDDETGVYQFHLFDTFGPRFSSCVGYGRRTGAQIDLRFDYPEGELANIFTWNEAKDSWTMDIGAHDESGGWREFAHKRPVRSC